MNKIITFLVSKNVAPIFKLLFFASSALTITGYYIGNMILFAFSAITCSIILTSIIVFMVWSWRRFSKQVQAAVVIIVLLSLSNGISVTHSFSLGLLLGASILGLIIIVFSIIVDTDPFLSREAQEVAKNNEQNTITSLDSIPTDLLERVALIESVHNRVSVISTHTYLYVVLYDERRDEIDLLRQYMSSGLYDEDLKAMKDGLIPEHLYHDYLIDKELTRTMRDIECFEGLVIDIAQELLDENHDYES